MASKICEDQVARYLFRRCHTVERVDGSIIWRCECQVVGSGRRGM
jgi:hypothetical protein